MRRTLLTLLVLVAVVWAVPTHTQTRLVVPGGATLPATCTVRDVWFRTATNIGLHQCTSANTWTFLTSGGVSTAVTLTSGQLIVGAGTTNIGVGNLSGDVTTSGGTATTIAANAVTDAKFRTSAALTVVGRALNSTGNIADIALSDGQTVKRVGTSLTSARFGPASVSVLTSGTAATYTVPAGIYRLRVRLIGGGGGGGGADGGSSQAGAGSGGGSGGYVEKVYSTTPGATFTYTIGALGAGGTAGNNAGTAGGNTLFDEGGSVLTGSGGGGGSSFAAGTTYNVASVGAGGAATGGDVNIPGTVGLRGWRWSGTQVMPGQGASSLLGGGGAAANSDSVGNSASGYGAGGGGAGATTTTDRAGGNGTVGVIIVEEYN